MHCTQCKVDRSSRHSTCYGSCGSGSCRHVCSYCGGHTLIESAVVSVGVRLGLSKNNPILLEFQRQKSLVDNGNRNSFTMEISEATLGGTVGPKRYVVYDKTREFQITGVVFHNDY